MKLLIAIGHLARDFLWWLTTRWLFWAVVAAANLAFAVGGAISGNLGLVIANEIGFLASVANLKLCREWYK